MHQGVYRDEITLLGIKIVSSTESDSVTEDEVVDGVVSDAARAGFADSTSAYVDGGMMPLGIGFVIVVSKLGTDDCVLGEILLDSREKEDIPRLPVGAIRDIAESTYVVRKLAGNLVACGDVSCLLGGVAWIKDVLRHAASGQIEPGRSDPLLDRRWHPCKCRTLGMIGRGSH